MESLKDRSKKRIVELYVEGPKKKRLKEWTPLERKIKKEREKDTRKLLAEDIIREIAGWKVQQWLAIECKKYWWHNIHRDIVSTIMTYKTMQHMYQWYQRCFIVCFRTTTVVVSWSSGCQASTRKAQEDLQCSGPQMANGAPFGTKLKLNS